MSAFPEIFRFELLRQIKRPMAWLFITVFIGLVVAGTKNPGPRADDVLYNAPLDVAALAILLGMMSLMVAAILAGDAAARDVQTRTDSLMYVLPLGRTEYVLGRFLAAYAVHALVLVFAIALLAGMSLQWPAEMIGPFRPASYAFALFVYVLPNALVAHAFMFAAATFTRRAIAAWGVGALLFFLSLFIPEFIGGQRGHWIFARWFDPSGYATVREYMDTWAPAQQNARLLPFADMVLTNRLFWVSVAFVTVAGVIARFRFEHHAPRTNRSRVTDTADDAMPGTPVALPTATRDFGRRTRLHQLVEVFRFSLGQMVRNRATLLLIAGPALFFFAVPEALEHIGVPLEATTSRLMLTMQRAAIVTITIPTLVALFFTGEVIWAEREARVNAMTDAAPVADWVVMTGKLLALLPLLLAHQALLLLATIGIQRVLGYTEHEVGFLARYLFGLQMVDYVLFIALAAAIHAVANNKYVAHLVFGIVWFMSYRMEMFGIERDLFAYSAAPAWSHSDMLGFGHTLAPWFWHKLFWLGCAALLLLLARAVWPRGAESGLTRLRAAPRRLRAFAPVAAAIATIVLVTGGFVYWNTDVLNERVTMDEGADRREAYERTYGRYATLPQPRVSSMTLRVELFPAQGSARITGRYALVNEGVGPVDTVLVATSLQAETHDVGFDRAARALLRDDRHGHHLYVLERPLLPGDSVRMSFEVVHSPRGFGGRANPIKANVALIDYEEGDWLPRLGYQPSRELISHAERRERGLAPRPGIPSLEDEAARQDRLHANSTLLDIIVATDSAHTVAAPGELRRTWREGDRRWFHYATDIPVRESWVILSAPYARRTDSWNGVGIEVLHHPEHTLVVDHVVRSARSSLEHFTELFGPYPYRSLRFAERPGYGGSANAHPGFIDYDEGLALMDAPRDPRAIDFVFGVIAHEIAHQWWGHHLTPAYVEGAPLLSESLAWYSALSVVEREYGRAHLQRMLAMLRESYLTPRARASEPLIRARDWFASYRKGPFAMQALREYVGEERVTVALRALLAKHTGPDQPLATSLDLYAELRAVTPDSLHYLLNDLLLTNTYWDLRADSARAEPLPGGDWRVRLDVRAAKAQVDTAGAETAQEMDEWIDIGVYAAAATEGERGEPLYRGRHRITDGRQRIVVVVPGRPALAGIDPDQVLIDSYAGDNFAEVVTDP